MRRKRKLKKPAFSFKGIQPRELKRGLSDSEYSPGERLKDKEYVRSALIQCLQDGDAKGFKEILRSHLEVINKTQFAKVTKLSERTLYRMVSEDGNPTLDNIAKIVHALCA